jgi:hypothetical protein
VSELLSALQTIGTVLGFWAVVSVAAAVVMIPWFRAQASANAALSRRARNADWSIAVHAVEEHRVATR